MTTIHTLFALDGRIGRWPFALGIVGVLAAAWLGIEASLAALPWMATVLAPRGINAAFALNAIWAVIGIVTLWTLIALSAKRLSARGRWPWWGASAVLPLAALALANDTLFLASRYIVLPDMLQYAIGGVAGAIALWVLYEGLAHGD